MTEPRSSETVELTGTFLDEGGITYFIADDGARYVVDGAGPWPLGAWMRVRALVDHSVASIRQRLAGRLGVTGLDKVHSRFEADGNLVARDGVTLLQTSDNHLYALSDASHARAGQRVHVVGTLIPISSSFFDEGEACVLTESVEAVGE